MNKFRNLLPLSFRQDARAKKVSTFQRFIAVLFGSPNARRANGIVFSGFDIFGKARGAIAKISGKDRFIPIYEIDRIGTIYNERLPRIWLSEELFNTSMDGKGRIYVECYPSGPDVGGEKAFELGDRYLEEGFSRKRAREADKSKDCFCAAEILYLHALRRGNRQAARRLRSMYDENLCEGDWYESYMHLHAKHAPKRPCKSRICA